MTDGLKIEPQEDHIRVSLSDDFEFDPSSSEEQWAQLARMCEQYGTHRVLVEGKAPSAEPETRDVIASGQHSGVVPRLWIAFHFDEFVPDEKSEIFEVIAASKGVRVKHFADRDHALMWLRNNSPS